MKITIQYIGTGFRVYITGKPEYCGFGLTKTDAIGDLVSKYHHLFSITEILDNTGV